MPPASPRAETAAVPILTYHSLDDSGSVISVAPRAFREHMGSLRDHGFSGISLGRLLDAWEGRAPLPARPAVLTFDDAFRNFARPPVRSSRPRASRPRCSRWPGGAAGPTTGPASSRACRACRCSPPRSCATWRRAGFEIGSHGLTHAALDGLSAAEAEREVGGRSGRWRMPWAGPSRCSRIPTDERAPASAASPPPTTGRRAAWSWRPRGRVTTATSFPASTSTTCAGRGLFRTLGTPLGHGYLALRGVGRRLRPRARPRDRRPPDRHRRPGRRRARHPPARLRRLAGAGRRRVRSHGRGGATFRFPSSPRRGDARQDASRHPHRGRASRRAPRARRAGPRRRLPRPLREAVHAHARGGRPGVRAGPGARAAVVVNNQYRFMDIHREARRRIGTPEFGDLLFVSVQQSFFSTEATEAGWRGRGPRRTWKEFGTHVVDLCRFFFDEDPVAVTARMPRPGGAGPDLLDLVQLEFSRDRVAQVVLDRLCRGPHRYLTVRLDGSAGCIETRLGGGARCGRACAAARAGRSWASTSPWAGGRASSTASASARSRPSLSTCSRAPRAAWWRRCWRPWTAATVPPSTPRTTAGRWR